MSFSAQPTKQILFWFKRKPLITTNTERQLRCRRLCHDRFSHRNRDTAQISLISPAERGRRAERNRNNSRAYVKLFWTNKNLDVIEVSRWAKKKERILARLQNRIYHIIYRNWDGWSLKLVFTYCIMMISLRVLIWSILNPTFALWDIRTSHKF